MRMFVMPAAAQNAVQQHRDQCKQTGNLGKHGRFRNKTGLPDRTGSSGNMGYSRYRVNPALDLMVLDDGIGSDSKRHPECTSCAACKICQCRELDRTGVLGLTTVRRRFDSLAAQRLISQSGVEIRVAGVAKATRERQSMQVGFCLSKI